MGNTVKVRSNYRADYRYLVRMLEAMEIDPYHSKEWLLEGISLIKKLSLHLHNADEYRLPEKQ